jgi:hypothetical protein
MDETTREVINTIYIALGTAAGIGVLDAANAIIAAAVKDRSVRDPAARDVLRHLVAACPPDTLEQANEAAANLSESTLELASAIGGDSLARLSGHIARRVAAINASTPVDEIRAIVGMIDAVEGYVNRVAAKAPAADATVDA